MLERGTLEKLEAAAMISSLRSARTYLVGQSVALAVASLLLTPLIRTPAAAQVGSQTGSVSGRVVDDQGLGLAGAEVRVVGTSIATQTRSNGEYLLPQVPAGTRNLQGRLLGYRPQDVSVTVTAGQQTNQDFTLRRDPLQLQTMVVTGTSTPRMNLDASVAVTTLTATEIQAAAPRSTTEMLRYVPGFTRIESSGGEVNQNISMRGVLGVEYVAFLEDGMPVFPTMHTFFMNADNLFRFDTNVERLEVVRGGSSPLFGSNTPGAIVNFINKSGGDIFAGTMRATAATKGLARYDLTIGGPFGNDWRFSAGGFYRYDHGVRDPGFPGIRGGQLKANITRLLDNGSLRFSVKHLDDRNQFILPLPFTNPDDPDYVPGLSDYASMNTAEALDLRVNTPIGDLRLPLDNGLKTKATWFTADVSLNLSDEWFFQNTAQVMQNDQEWNALIADNILTVQEWVTAPPGQTGLGLPAGTTAQLTFTNHYDTQGNRLPFDTPNGLVAPGQLAHVSKPISAVHDQLQLRRSFGRHALSIGAYAANYTQDNHWNFTQILMDVRNNPRFLDAVVTAPGGSPTVVSQNGFRKFLSGYTNGTGQATIVSGVLGGEVQLTDQLRADLGVRLEYNDFVQNRERTSTFDLDNDPATPVDNETFGNGSFLHFNRDITDWSASVGLNYRANENWSVYGSGSRGYKMPALDEFINAASQAQADLFDSREVQAGEVGLKYATGGIGLTVNAFYTKVKNIVGQGLIVDPGTGASVWQVLPSPDERSYGSEVEAFVSPVEGLQLIGSATVLEAELTGGPDSLASRRGRRLSLVPTALGNLAALYSPRRVPGLQFKADWHFVGSRFSEGANNRLTDTKLPSYNYFNIGAGFSIPNAGIRVNADLLNAFQSKGLEEGNPRLIAVGGTPIFVARPILPRRLQVSLDYDFGGGGPQR
jgi:outer membrane receptor protein involved in Fe transport